MKKTISLLLTLALISAILAPMAAANTQLYTDVAPDRWTFPYIELLSNRGIVTGYEDGTLQPTKNMSNGEFVTLLYRTVIGEPEDVPNSRHWTEKYIKAAISRKITTDSDMPFEQWTEPVTKQGMAKMIMKALSEVYGEKLSTDTTPAAAKIKDWAEVCDECKLSVAQAFDKGIITGSDGYFKPWSTATREEVFVIVTRLIEKDSRVEYIGGIPFNRLTDVTDDGLMKIAVAERFIMKAVNTLRFYKENDKYYFTIVLPETPDGFEMMMRIDMDPGIGFITNAYLPERMIPSQGKITKELPGNYMAQVFRKGDIQIILGVMVKPDAPLVTKQDGYANLLAVYEDGQLVRFSTAIGITNGAGSAKTSKQLDLEYSDYFDASFPR